MKKISLIIVTVILNFAIFSCTPESIVDQVNEQACCGDDEEILPPPPPPPPGDDGVIGG